MSKKPTDQAREFAEQFSVRPALDEHERACNEEIIEAISGHWLAGHCSRDKEMATLTKQLATSRSLVKEICDEWNEPCNVTCSSYGHDRSCKSVNIAEAKRAMAQEIARLTSFIIRMQAACGIPNPQKACRVVIDLAKEVLGKIAD
jgi:hypothetical protein